MFKNPDKVGEVGLPILEEYSEQGISTESVIVVSYKAQSAQYELHKDVILPLATRNQLEESLTKIKYHKVIYDDWGFGEIDKVGRSNILNFYGPPGTGKTLAAEAYAGCLDLPIIKLGIAEVESKLMGETSKNIQKAFEDASVQGAVLFFDEADTLLGSRLSSVTQGVDNEINAMRSTMLIELEKFSGIVIFATNFGKNYDSAFRSRISHHVEFTLPDVDARQLLWNKMIVSKIPLKQERDILIEQCVMDSEGFSGREIRNCLRLALPKVIKEAVDGNVEPQLTFEHLEQAINSIKKAQNEIGQDGATETAKNKRQRKATEILMARQILNGKRLEEAVDEGQKGPV